MILLIMGMHRSGTSALAGMLNEGGVPLGEVFMPPLPENPKGFFEDLRMQRVNKEILASIGRDWNNVPEMQELKKVPTPILQYIPQIYQRFRSQYTTWAWKDPRLCLTFPLWANVLPLREIRVIYITRHPMSVAVSIHTRNQMPIENGLQLWRHYNERIIQIIHHYKLPYVFLRYEDLIQSPQPIQNMLEEKFGMDLKEGWKFISKELNRSEAAKQDRELPQEIQQFYERLLQSQPPC